MNEKRSALLWYVLTGILLLTLLDLFLVQSQVAMIPYSDFKALLAAGKVTEATLGQNRINAVIDLKGAEKLLPPAEYKQIIDSALPRAIVHQTSRVFQSFLRPQRSSKARNTHGFG